MINVSSLSIEDEIIPTGETIGGGKSHGIEWLSGSSRSRLEQKGKPPVRGCHYM